MKLAVRTTGGTAPEAPCRAPCNAPGHACPRLSPPKERKAHSFLASEEERLTIHPALQDLSVCAFERTDQMANDLRDKGIQIANQAVEADNAQRYEEAIKGYIKAAEYLLTATKYEKNPVTLKTIRDKVPRRPASQAAARAPLWWHF